MLGKDAAVARDEERPLAAGDRPRARVVLECGRSMEVVRAAEESADDFLARVRRMTVALLPARIRRVVLIDALAMRDGGLPAMRHVLLIRSLAVALDRAGVAELCFVCSGAHERERVRVTALAATLREMGVLTDLVVRFATSARAKALRSEPAKSDVHAVVR
jgi:hypothetical protein